MTDISANGHDKAIEQQPRQATEREKLASEGDLGRLWRQYMPLMRGDIILGSLVINILALALPVVTLQVYDRIIPYDAMQTLSYLVTGILVVLVLDFALKTVRSWLAGWTGAKYEHDAGNRALDKIMKGRLEDVEATPAGIHIDRMTAIDTIRDFYAGQASLTLVDLPFVFIFLGVLWWIAGWLVLVPIVLLVFAIVVAFSTGRALRKSLDERLVWDDRRYNFLIEALSGVHVIKSMAMEKLILRRYERLIKSSASSGYSVSFFSGFAQSIGTSISQITMAAVAGFGSILVVSNMMSVGGLAAATLLAGRVVQPVMRAMSLWTRFQAVTLAEQKVAEFDDITPARIGGKKPAPEMSSVELDNASFRYGPDSEDVLRNINLTINAGDIIGISGGNGSGKTTLLHMLFGRLEPTGGSLLINGEDASGIDTDDFRKQVGFMSQKPVLFQGTVLDNLTMFEQDKNLEKAIDLATQLGLDVIFARQPEGYDTKLGDTASSALPGGVVQRINMVRALVNEPNLILFDEANASLDSRSETMLRQMLMNYKGDVAIVLVTYRPSLLALADRRYLLDGGRLEAIDNSGRRQQAPTQIEGSQIETEAKPSSGTVSEDTKGDA